MSDASTPSVLVVGCGAMGSLVAAYLLRGAGEAAGCKAFVADPAWRDRIAHFKANGMGLIDADGNRFAAPAADIADRVGLTSDAKSLLAANGGAGFDAVVVLVKGSQSADVGGWLAAEGLLAAGCAVVSLQNGQGNADALQAAMTAAAPGGAPPAASVFAGLTYNGAALDGHDAKHNGRGLTCVCASAVEGGASGAAADAAAANAKRLVAALSASGLDAASLDRRAFDERAWAKLVVNAAINPLTALLAVHNGALAELAPCRALLRTVVHECCAAGGAATGGAFGGDAEKVLSDVVAVCRATHANVSSMLSDAKRGVPTEVEAINGAVVRAAAAASPAIPTPLNALLLRLVGSAAAQTGEFAQRAAATREAVGAELRRDGHGLPAELVADGLAALAESASRTIVPMP